VKPPKRTAQTVTLLRQVNGPNRLEVLRSYQVIDAEPEPVFDDLMRLSAFICGTPTALIPLVDDERQWFKARVGLKTPQIACEHAFFQYAVLANDVYEVSDATADTRFTHNPLVTDDPHIRFYAGAPLLTPEGQPLGSLCALDTVPRHLSPD